ASGPGRHQRDHDIGTDRANEPDEIARNFVASPLLERLVDAERVAEVDCAREVLFGAVESMERRELLGSQHAERFEELRTDLVLATIAARGGRERGAI